MRIINVIFRDRNVVIDKENLSPDFKQGRLTTKVNNWPTF